MRELGYEEGRDYRLEMRWGEGKLERMPALAAELVKLKVRIIIAASSPSTLAAKDATRTIPIVMPISSDPVGDGWCRASPAPAAISRESPTWLPSWGETARDAQAILPKRSHSVGVLWNPAYKGMSARYREARSAGSVMGVDVRSIEVRDSREMEAAFEDVSRNRPDGLLLLADPLTLSLRLRVVEFAREKKLPAIYETREFAEAGGLMSYGPNISEQFRARHTTWTGSSRAPIPASCRSSSRPRSSWS
jgi:putative ABC transport system substrate-binding protein